jgi:ferredoxin--NADP+ reductase
MADSQTRDRPRLRVAVVGAGPAGFYATLDLFNHSEIDVQVDMFDRLPTPYGLVRFGVAPDHPKIKSVIKVYERGVQAAADRFRLFGHVELGKDVTVDELLARYHAVIITFGAQTDKKLGVPGEDLPGVYAAREFVAWYNCHPDYAEAQFKLYGERAVVIGVGNVAIDVARILMRTAGELCTTDIGQPAQDLVTTSPLTEVTVLARRGPVQAAATPQELHEMTEMEACDLVISHRDLELDPVTNQLIAEGKIDSQAERALKSMREEALHEPRVGRKLINMRFYVSPVEFLGTDHVEAVKIVRNEMYLREDGSVAARGTDETEIIPCGAVFRSIGYAVAPVSGVPYDAKRQRIPHDKGQVLDESGSPVAGLFVAGWAKRGPSGVIGTNKPCAVETVQTMLGRFAAGELQDPVAGDIDALLRERGVQFVSFDQWKLLDQLETAAGAAEGRPRVKFRDVKSMLEALAGVPA